MIGKKTGDVHDTLTTVSNLIYLLFCQLLLIGKKTGDVHDTLTTVSNLIYLLYCQLLLIDKKTGDVHDTLTTVSNLLDVYNGSAIQKESLKVFFLILQVCHYLMAGQVSYRWIVYLRTHSLIKNVGRLKGKLRDFLHVS